MAQKQKYTRIPKIEELMEAANDARLFARRGLLVHAHRHPLINELRIFCRLETNGRAPERHELSRFSRRLNRGRFDPTAAELNELRRMSTGCPRVANWMRRSQLA